MANEIQFTEGVLCRDGKDADGEIAFAYRRRLAEPAMTRRDVMMGSMRRWCSDYDASLIATWKIWTEEEWLATYNRSDLPRRSSARECFLEL